MRARAIRRAAREAESAAAAAARSRRAARGARFGRLTSKRRAVASWRRTGRARGPLAAKRRRTIGLILVGFLILQALTWAATADWGQRAAVLVASLFAIPVVAVFVL